MLFLFLYLEGRQGCATGIAEFSSKKPSFVILTNLLMRLVMSILKAPYIPGIRTVSAVLP